MFSDGEHGNACNTSSTTRTANISYHGGQFKSPIKSSCQRSACLSLQRNPHYRGSSRISKRVEKRSLQARRAHRRFLTTSQPANGATSSEANLRHGFLPEEYLQSLKLRNGRMPIASKPGSDVRRGYLFQCGTVTTYLRTPANDAEDDS